jgi:hypothetical protein
VPRRLGGGSAQGGLGVQGGERAKLIFGQDLTRTHPRGHGAMRGKKQGGDARGEAL